MALPVIAIQLGVTVGLWGLNKLADWLNGKPQLPKPRPREMDFAQARIGAPIPMVYGTVKVDVAVVVDLLNKRMQSDPTSGVVRYGGSLLLVIGQPPDRDVPTVGVGTAPVLRRLWYGDALATIDNANAGITHGNHRSASVELGGAGAGGSFFATIEFFDGRNDQLITAYPAAATLEVDKAFVRQGTAVDRKLIPGFERQMLLFVMAESDLKINVGAGTVFASTGESPNIPNIAVEVSATGRQAIGTAAFEANPAWAIYDLITRAGDGLTIDPDDIDLDSFETAANTLESEVNGCSFIISTEEPASSQVDSLLNQTDGALYIDQEDGKVHFRLARGDWNPLTARVINADNTLGFPNISNTSLEDAATQVRLTFSNREIDYKDDIATSKRMSNGVGQDGRTNTIDVHMPAVCTGELADRLAQREIKAYGKPRLSVKCNVSREFFDLKVLDVVRVNYPKRNVLDVFMRVLDIDFGQLADGKIGLTLVEDVFDFDMTGVFTPPAVVAPDVYPLTQRYVDEAPFFLIQRLFGQSVSQSSSHLFAAAVPEDIALGERVDTLVSGSIGPVGGSGKKGGGSGGSFSSYSPDVPASTFPIEALVATAYPRTAEPYDTSTGLVIKSVTGDIASIIADLIAFPVSFSDVKNGANLILVCAGGYGRKTGGEFMSFETITDHGDGTYTLNNVWRADMDTAPVDWPIDSRVYFVDGNQIGTRTWADAGTVYSKSLALWTFIAGSGHDAVDPTLIASRFSRVPRLMDLRASGYEASGTLGIPALTGGLKAVSELDGAIDLGGNEQPITTFMIVRGDDTTYAADAGTTFDVFAQKTGEDEVAIATGIAHPFGATGLTLGPAGHGAIDVIAYSKYTDDRRCWQAPRITVNAPRYRGLLAQGSFEYNALSPGWVTEVGSPVVQSGTTSLQQSAAGRWVVAVAAPAAVSQIINVSGYKPVGLTALLTWYSRAGSAAQTTKATIDALNDSASSPIATANSGNQACPTDHWVRRTTSLTLPITTARVRARIDMNAEVADNVRASRALLQIGQMTGQLLLNPNFDSSFTSWTNVVNSFGISSTQYYASDNGSTKQCAQGGSFATSEIRQDVAVPVGYEYGTAVVELARAHDALTGAAGDTGQVIIEARNGFGVLASTTGPAEDLSGTPNVWVRRRCALDIPDGTTTIRVRLLATEASFRSGALFDDLSLRIWKHLDAPHTVDFDFGTPARTFAPTDWPQWHYAHPTMPIPAAVWGGTSETPSTRRSTTVDGATHAWSDGVVHTSGTFTAYMNVDGSEAMTASAYVFTRTAAVSAVDLQTLNGYGDGTVFSIAVLMRTDEFTWGGACGLVGRRAADGVGWGIAIDSTGHVVATIQGASGTATATSADTVHDRSPRWVVITHDGANLVVYTKAGTATAGTGGVGAMTEVGAVLRIGRDRDTSATLPGQIARVMLWNEALSAGNAAAIVGELGADPSGLLTTWTANQPVWVPGAPDGSNATLVRCSPTDIPIAYESSLASDGDAYGLCLTRGNTNRVVTNDVTDTAHWGPEVGSFTLVRGVADPTGLARGIRIGQSTPSAGFRITDMPAPLAVFTWTTVLYLRSTSSAITLNVELLDSNGASKGVVPCALNALWQRFVVTHAWDAATPTAHLRLAIAAGGVGTYEVSHVLWSGYVGTSTASVQPPPYAIQDAGVTLGSTWASRTEALPVELNYEGELYAEGVSQHSTMFYDGVLVAIDNNADQHDKRMLNQVSSPAGVWTELFDSSGTLITGTPEIDFDLTASWKARARWNRLAIPDAGARIACVANGQYASAAGSLWGVSTTGCTRIRIGFDLAGVQDTPSTIVRRVVVRSREQKLDGTS